MNSTITDTEAVTVKINAYVDGCRQGDISILKGAFHPDARMFGAVGGDRYDVPITAMIDMVGAQPTGNHDARVLSIDVSGDAASVKLAESNFWGQDFIDYFLLARIDGDWQIVAKAFDNPGPTG
jgi:hypothetical protein